MFAYFRKKIEVIEPDRQSQNSDEARDHSDQQQFSHGSKSNTPSIMKNIPPADKMVRNKTPSPNLRFNLIDVLYAYAYVMRLYNGSPEDSLHQASESLLKLSAVLAHNASFESVETVVHSSLSLSRQSEDLYNSESFSLTALLDVASLIKGKEGAFVECALSDIHRLLKKGKEKLKALPEVDKEMCKSIWLAKKKVYFLLSWVHSSASSLQSLVPTIEILHREISVTHTQHLEDKKKLEEVWGGTKPPQQKTLIEEI